jgi:hypothetical protein
VLAARPAHRRHVGLHQLLHHLQPGTDRQGQQAFAHVGGNLLHRHTRPLRHGERTRVELDPLILLGTTVPCLLGVLGGSPETYHSAGLRRGTATSKFYETRDNLLGWA